MLPIFLCKFQPSNRTPKSMSIEEISVMVTNYMVCTSWTTVICCSKAPQKKTSVALNVGWTVPGLLHPSQRLYTGCVFNTKYCSNSTSYINKPVNPNQLPHVSNFVKSSGFTLGNYLSVSSTKPNGCTALLYLLLQSRKTPSSHQNQGECHWIKTV